MIKFRKLSFKHKRLYIYTQLLVFTMIIAMFIIAMNVEKIVLPTKQEKLAVPLGFILLLIVGTIAFANRLKQLFKIKFIGFAVMLVIMLLLDSVMDTLILGTALMLIPLALDDLVFKPLWNSIWYKHYE